MNRPPQVDGTQAIDRALLLLDILGDGPISGPEIVERSGLARSTALRVLSALQRSHYAARNRDGRYIVGPRILELAANQIRQTDIPELARRELDALVREFEETATLSVREGLECVCVAGRESPRPLRLTITPGSRTPLHAGAAAKILLAFAPEAVREQVLAGPLQRFTATTTVDPEALRRELRRVAESGAVETVGEIDPGVYAVSAPIFNANGDLAASICVAGLTTRIDKQRRKRLAARVREAANAVSAQLGFVL